MRALLPVAVVLVALAASVPPRAHAADAPPDAAGAREAGRPARRWQARRRQARRGTTRRRPALRTLTDAEVAPLLEGLKKALKAKVLSEAAPALDALAGVTHPDLEPALGKLLGHNLADVAARAARAMGERAGEKTAATLWNAWASPVNERRVDVRAALLDAFATMKAPLDPKQYVQVERLFTDAASPIAMDAVTRYFTAVATDKRPCKVFGVLARRAFARERQRRHEPAEGVVGGPVEALDEDAARRGRRAEGDHGAGVRVERAGAGVVRREPRVRRPLVGTASARRAGGPRRGGTRSARAQPPHTVGTCRWRQPPAIPGRASAKS